MYYLNSLRGNDIIDMAEFSSKEEANRTFVRIVELVKVLGDFRYVEGMEFQVEDLRAAYFVHTASQEMLTIRLHCVSGESR